MSEAQKASSATRKILTRTTRKWRGFLEPCSKIMEKYLIAAESDLRQIFDFYKIVCERQTGERYGPDWHYGTYLSEENLKKFMQNKEVHICKIYDDFRSVENLAGAAVLEKHADAKYRNGAWNVKARSEEILTLHLFAVHPDCRGKKIAEKMLHHMFDYGKRLGFRSMQLDVLKGNVPAEQLYIKTGFTFIEECTVTYEDTGEQVVHLYEKDLR